ncbi:coiled-coil domain-containing protein 34 [Pimephales promelas]|uniref:coiled-coil domain-containing protein 34 n=1 Tax=Pimephales promelas TaxID=90988 RepID=UPI001955CA87|nr:coiled-coil domain-containing protein 34 [Pimephales promelas]XP_039518117.1 coiled-coil domain-containing protein 34 [Pimephales promelas]XP_039518118.1 coiled-coil domain-containing protein 34 [Pimephales promelas]XP_039518119.1 coiled-coil domain-containing protein 34 [Pimephales promelas]
MMSAFPSSSSKSLTSTPLKSSVPQRSRSVESTGDSTSSLLSPIYHDSFELSDEEPEPDPPQRVHNITVTLDEDASPSRDEVDTTGLDDRSPSGNFRLSAWEQWIVEKAKEERVRKQQKAMEELTLKEKEEEQKKKLQMKKVACDCRIQEWLRMKREQEKKERECKEFQKSKEQLQEEKRRAEIEEKAREKYKEWMRKKTQEETARKLKEKQEAARREAEERERKEKAEESFKEWLDGVKTKGKLSRRSSASSAGNYNNVNYPSPSFVNPIPWKPIHVPQEDRTPRKSSARKRTAVSQSSRRLTHTPTDIIGLARRRR